MIGGPTDVVVEPNIVRAVAAPRDIASRPPAGIEALPRAIPLPENGNGHGSGSWPLQPEPAAPRRAPHHASSRCRTNCRGRFRLPPNRRRARSAIRSRRWPTSSRRGRRRRRAIARARMRAPMSRSRSNAASRARSRQMRAKTRARKRVSSRALNRDPNRAGRAFRTATGAAQADGPARCRADYRAAAGTADRSWSLPQKPRPRRIKAWPTWRSASKPPCASRLLKAARMRRRRVPHRLPSRLRPSPPRRACRAPRRASRRAASAKPNQGKTTLYDNLEQEMASLLGRPTKP